MNGVLFFYSCYQQEENNDILVQLLRANISIDKSTGITFIDCDKDVFRRKDDFVVARE